MRLRRLLPIVAVVVVAAGCDWPNIVPPGTAPVRYRDPIFNAVTVTSNVTYGSAVNLGSQTITLQLDVYQPTGDTVTSRPAIVWVHGGSFSCGSKTSAELVDEATTFAKEGYVNVSINYRLESPGCSGSFSNCGVAIQEAAADAQTAVRYLRTNAATYGIDPNRIAIGGSSAGAITALNVGYASSENPSATRARRGLDLGRAARRRHHIAGRRPRPRLPLHHRPARAVSVGGEHHQRRARRRDSTRSSSPGTGRATCRTPSTVSRSSTRRGTSCGGRWTSPTPQPEAADRWSGPIGRALRSRRFAADRHVSFGPAPGGIGTWH